MSLRFADLSIRAKIIMMLTMAIVVAQLITAAMNLFQEATRYASMKTDTLLASAQVLSAGVGPAVVRKDAQAARQALKAMARMPDIVYVAVEDAGGRHIADLGVAETLESDVKIDERTSAISVGAFLRSRTIEIRVPVIENGARVGQLLVISETGDLAMRLFGVLQTTLLGAAASLIVALSVALRLQTAVTRPLAALTKIMARVRSAHDYSLRIKAESKDEFGVLVESFNGMIADIRERDARLARQREGLEIEVVQRTEDFKRARDAAESASVAKSEFLATMSHEIRTPMNGILVMAELLAAGDLPQRSRRHAEVIVNSGKSLLAIINDVLDISKIEAGKLEVETLPVNPLESAETAVSLFHERAHGKGLDLSAFVDPRVPATVDADPVRLNQVLSNLVNNALKFTQEGYVSVRVMLDPRDQRRVRFSVVDTGIGIPADKVSQIFDAFTQADQTTTRRFGGTGLGLSIAKRLVDSMGGGVEVESREGHGSTFSFSLRATEQARPPEWPRVEGGSKALVCIAGVSTRAALTALLQSSGFAVERCEPQAMLNECEGVRLVIADVEALAACGARPGGVGAVVALADMGQQHQGEGFADTRFERPLSRADVATLVAAIRDGRPIQDTAAPKSAADTIADFRGRRVLVADDNAVNREVAVEALRRFGIEADVAEDGLAALEAITATPFDIVFMDGDMPRLDGFEATRRLREIEKRAGGRRTAVIALTAHVVGASANAWRAAGMDGILHKPFTIAALGEVLGRHVTRNHPASARAAETPTPPPARAAAGEARAPVDSDEAILDPRTVAELERMAAGGKSEFVTRITSLYLKLAPTSVTEIEEAARAGDRERVGKGAHALKSMSLNIGAKRVAAAAAEIERQARVEGQLPLPEEVAQLQTLIGQACAGVEALARAA